MVNSTYSRSLTYQINSLINLCTAVVTFRHQTSEIDRSATHSSMSLSVAYCCLRYWLTVDNLIAYKVLLTASHIRFHQKSTTLAYVLEVTVIHSLYVQINYVNLLLYLGAYFVFSDY